MGGGGAENDGGLPEIGGGIAEIGGGRAENGGGVRENGGGRAENGGGLREKGGGRARNGGGEWEIRGGERRNSAVPGGAGAGEEDERGGAERRRKNAKKRRGVVGRLVARGGGEQVRTGAVRVRPRRSCPEYRAKDGCADGCVVLTQAASDRGLAMAAPPLDCGPLHSQCGLDVVIQEEKDFEAWLSGLKRNQE